jgi:hypothetical protein
MGRFEARRLRSALEEFWSGEHQASLARFRDPDDDVAPASRGRGRWLVSVEAAEVFEEVVHNGELTPQESAALRAHIVAVRYALALLPAQAELRARLERIELVSTAPRDLPESLAQIACADDEKRRAEAARELEHALRPHATAYTAVHARAEQPLRVDRAAVAAADAGPERVQPSGLILSLFSPEAMPASRDLPELAWRDAAVSFLAKTEAAADDAVRHCLRKRNTARVIPWHTLLRGLRAPELDSPSGKAQRWQRSVAWLRRLGFEREMLSRMRAEVDRDGVLPGAQVLALAVPLDLRVAQTSIDYGVMSDVLAASGAARALGLSLTHPALPPELRLPHGATTAGVLGSLAAQLWAHRDHMTRVQELSAAEAERVCRLAGTFVLLGARADVALALLDAPETQMAEARVEATATQLSVALRCDVPPGVAGLLGSNRVLAREHALEQLAAFSLQGVLRERFDADWFRNPRCAELLRGLCERGSAHTPEAACVELGTTLESAASHAIELVT